MFVGSDNLEFVGSGNLETLLAWKQIEFIISLPGKTVLCTLVVM